MIQLFRYNILQNSLGTPVALFQAAQLLTCQSHLHGVLKSHPRAKRGISESFSDFAKEVQSSKSVHAFDQVHTQCLNSAVLSPKQYLNSTFQVECGLGFKLPRGHLLADARLCFAPERI